MNSLIQLGDVHRSLQLSTSCWRTSGITDGSGAACGLRVKKRGPKRNLTYCNSHDVSMYTMHNSKTLISTHILLTVRMILMLFFHCKEQKSKFSIKLSHMYDTYTSWFTKAARQKDVCLYISKILPALLQNGFTPPTWRIKDLPLACLYMKSLLSVVVSLKQACVLVYRARPSLRPPGSSSID